MAVVLAACGGSQPPTQQPVANAAPAPSAEAAPAPSASAAPARSASAPVDSASSAGPVTEVMAKLRYFRDEMCKCADKACADRVADELTRWIQDFARNSDRAARPSEADVRDAQDSMESYTKCQGALMAKPP